MITIASCGAIRRFGLSMTVLVAVLLHVPGVVCAQFVDVTTPLLANAGSFGAGVAWGDYDNDGDLDLYLCNYDHASNKLFRNDLGTFVDATSGPLGSSDTTICAVWGDYDNDADLDLYLVTKPGTNRLLRNDGGGTFVDVTSGPVGNVGDGAGASWGDYDNDGDIDLYVSNSEHQVNRLYRNDGGGVFADVTSSTAADSGDGTGAMWVDYDNDGDLDLCSLNYFGPIKLLRNDGGGAFVNVAKGPLVARDGHNGMAWGDYDNDSDMDAFITNDGVNRLIRNDGGDVFVDVTPTAMADSSGTAVAWGDYDNDGDLDLLVANSTQPDRLFRNDGGGTFVNVATGALADTSESHSAAWGDYDGDGDLDLYVSNVGGANHLFRNNQANGNHWLEVKLKGMAPQPGRSNKAGIGARVRLVAAGVSRIREISGGSGYLSQDAMVASFGLGTATSADSLIVRWPSGIVQIVHPVGVNRVLTVTEGLGVTGVEQPHALPRTLELSQGVPSPFSTSTHIAYSMPRAGSVSLTIHDLQGRRVARLADGEQAAGSHAVEWTGSDGVGRPLGAGVYFVRLTVTDANSRESQVRKIVMTN